MPFIDRTEENSIVIGETRYSVHQLSVAQRRAYWEWVDALAKLHLNPWGELYDKVRDIPDRLQEIVFVGSRKSLFPLTLREKTGICCTIDAIWMLVELSFDCFEGLSVHNSQSKVDLASKVKGEMVTSSREQQLQVYLDLIDVLGDSYTGQPKPAEPQQVYRGADAVEFLQGKVAEEAKAAGIAEAGKDPLGTAGTNPPVEKVVDDGE